MLTLGSADANEEEKYFQEQLALKMIQLLEEHGWSFTYGRDPVLVLIEYEELTNEENEDEQ